MKARGENMTKALEIRNLSKTYDAADPTPALSNVNFDIDGGKFVAIMGTSGSGKSTLLNIVATMDTATSGVVLVNNTEVSTLSDADQAKFRRDSLSFVFQNYNLLENLTLHENIALALTIKKYPKAEINTRVLETAKKLHIDTILDKFPNQVSGGQRQRCACARALAVDPQLILADEPTGALDTQSSKQLLNIFQQINQENQVSILLVTHDPLAASYCDEIIFMQDGKIIETLVNNKKSQKKAFLQVLDFIAKQAEEESYVS